MGKVFEGVALLLKMMTTMITRIALMIHIVYTTTSHGYMLLCYKYSSNVNRQRKEDRTSQRQKNESGMI